MVSEVESAAVIALRSMVIESSETIALGSSSDVAGVGGGVGALWAKSKRGATRRHNPTATSSLCT